MNRPKNVTVAEWAQGLPWPAVHLPVEYQGIQQFIQQHGAPPADVIFESSLLDTRFCAETGQECPLREAAGSTANQIGCYAWIAEPETVLPGAVLYVGKAVRLRNRLGQHYLRGPFLDSWANECEESGRLSPCTFVAVWFSDTRAAMEAELIRKLSPKYNKQVEQIRGTA